MATKGEKFVVLLGVVAGAYATYEYLHFTGTKDKAFSKARQLSNGKGIINIGAGPHGTHQAQVMAEIPDILANIDIVPNGMPHFIQLDIEKEQLPFADKQFGCAFASHVLEHLEDWQFALEEMVRVADYVVLVLPSPSASSGWFNVDHKQHFSRDDIGWIMHLYPNALIYS